MAMTYDPIFAADPNNAANVASNASIIIFDPNDPGKAPITITDVTGSPLPNPITVNKNGFGPAFQHATLDRVGWFGAGFTGYFTSYEGMKAVAVEAAADAQAAALTAGTEAAAVATAAIGTATTASTSAAASAATAASNASASATAAANAAALVNAPADSAIAAAINGAGTATKTALSATIGEQVLSAPRTTLGPRWVFDGDSITIASTVTLSGIQNRGSSWPAAMTRASMGRIDYIHNAAVAGQNSAAALGRFDANVAPHTPDVVCLTIGTNDVGGAVPQATWQDNLIAYAAKVKAIGARLVLGAIYPTTNNVPAGRPATTRAWNEWLYVWAATNDVPLIPFDTLTDPITGGWPVGWSSDGIHPNPNSTINPAIGEFAWQNIAPIAGSPSVRRAKVNGGDLIPNGFFTTLTTAVAAPTVSAAQDTATGTVAAGTYSYKVSTRTSWGESALSAGSTATLTGAGKITLTLGAVAGNQGYKVYRKAPAGADWLYLTTTASNASTFVDDGSYTPGAAATGIDTSRIPNSISVGSPSPHKAGAGVRTVVGVRGNVMRFTPYESGASSDYLTITGLVPGTVVEFTGLVASTDTVANINIRYRAGTTAVVNVSAVSDIGPAEMRLFSTRHAVPATADNARIYIETTAGNGWIDVAELRFAVVS